MIWHRQLQHIHSCLEIYITVYVILYGIIKAHVKWEWLHLPFFLNDDDRNYVEPDLSVICNLSKIDEEGCHGAPDWIIEIVSPSSERMDYVVKQFKYRTAGVREYWVIDKPLQKVTVFDFENDKMFEYDFTQKIPVAIYNGELEIELSRFA